MFWVFFSEKHTFFRLQKPFPHPPFALLLRINQYIKYLQKQSENRIFEPQFRLGNKYAILAKFRFDILSAILFFAFHFALLCFYPSTYPWFIYLSSLSLQT